MLVQSQLVWKISQKSMLVQSQAVLKYILNENSQQFRMNSDEFCDEFETEHSLKSSKLASSRPY